MKLHAKNHDLIICLLGYAFALNFLHVFTNIFHHSCWTEIVIPIFPIKLSNCYGRNKKKIFYCIDFQASSTKYEHSKQVSGHKNQMIENFPLTFVIWSAMFNNANSFTNWLSLFFFSFSSVCANTVVVVRASLCSSLSRKLEIDVNWLFMVILLIFSFPNGYKVSLNSIKFLIIYLLQMNHSFKSKMIECLHHSINYLFVELWTLQEKHYHCENCSILKRSSRPLLWFKK